MRIGISFGDNDFHNTLMPFVKIIMDAIEWNPILEEKLTKERIVELFNGMSFSLYRMFQNSWEHSNGGDNHMKRYLMINVDRVYINNEIDKKFENYDSWANGEFFYVDTDNHQVQCY